MRRDRFRLPLLNNQGGARFILGFVALYDAQFVNKPNNTLLPTLEDFSGNGWHGTATSTYQATLLRNVVNGQNAFSFTGSDYYATSLYGPGAAFTILVTVGGANPRSLVRFQTSASPYVVYPYGSAPWQAIEYTSGGNISAGLTANQWQVGIYRSKPSTATNGRQTFKNGTLVAQGTTANYNHSIRLYIGAYAVGPAEFADCYATTIAIWDKFLTDAEVQYISNFEMRRVGLL